MEFTIYTLGDVESFRAALTAVSMLFNPSNTEGWVGNSGELGLGYMAALALTIGLLMTLFQGLFTMKFEVGQLLIGVIVYVIMFVPKFSVNIEDYYTGTIQRVDGVPLGIAFPGSAISAMTREISTQFNTAFSTTSTNYMGFTESGFMTPLKILSKLRFGASNFSQSDPNLARTIQSFVIDCTTGRPEFDENIVRSRPDPMKYLTDTVASAGINGLTVAYSAANPNGVNMTCQAAATFIQNGLTTYYSTASIGAGAANPTGLSKFAKMISTRVNSTSAQTQGGYSTTDYEDSFRALTQLSGAEAKAFAITSLTANLITTSRYCANNAADEAELARCLPTIQAARQYEEDSAASGTLFQRTMLHSMSIMLFLFYCFAPIVALMVLALGQKGMKILGGYLVFGIWSQSWLPVATIINYFIQQKVFNEFAKFGSDPTQVLTIADAPALYDMLATNVAVASDLMAATPILTLALLTGSFFALTGVATRLSGKDYYDEKANTASLVSNGAIASNTNSFGGTMGLGSFGQGMSSGPGINRQSTYTAMQSQVRSLENSADKAVSQAESQAYSTIFANEKTAADSYRVAQSFGTTDSKLFKQAFQKQYKMDDAKFQQFESDQKNTQGMGTSTRAAVTDAAATEVAGGLDIGNAVGKLAKLIPGNRGGAAPVKPAPDFVGPSPEAGSPPKTGDTPFSLRVGGYASTTSAQTDSAEVKKDVRQTQGGSGGGGETLGTGTTAGGERGRSATYDEKLSYDKTKALTEGLSAKYGKQSVSQTTETLSRAQRYREMAMDTSQAANSVGTTGSFTGIELANLSRVNQDFTSAVRQAGADANLQTGGEFNKEVDKTLASFRGTALGAMDKDTQKDLATFFALEKTDQAAYARVASELFDDNNIRSFTPVAETVGADMIIGQGLRNEVLDATSTELTQGAAQAAAAPKIAAVQPGLAAADPLENATEQVAAIKARNVEDKGQVAVAGAGFVREFAANITDPSYGDVRTQAQATLQELKGKIPEAEYKQLETATNNMAQYTKDRGEGDGLRVIGSKADLQTLGRLNGQYRQALAGASLRLDKNLSPEDAQAARESIAAANIASSELRTARGLTGQAAPGKPTVVGARQNSAGAQIYEPHKK